ncbi:hypothetical protein ABEB36_013904 [Hypothenemus hampei]|uniref:Peptidase S1 domain-containing protein n=1 Tax=Hypothenemus hampei TaxID=57062 RepID=A0ABD1E5L6_HYPHA
MSTNKNVTHFTTNLFSKLFSSGPPQMVKLGAVNLKDTENYVQEIIIEKFVNHPEYKRPKKYHDIAILFLRKSATFSAFVRPACLNTVEEIVYPQAKATGYGKTSHDGLDTSQILLKVDLDIIPNSICCKYLRFRKHEMPENLVKQMMCAGDLKEGRDTCQGDSGGPLQVVLNEPYCMYSIIGVISFGQFCGMKYSPGVYTKVDQYVPWIENTIWN